MFDKSPTIFSLIETINQKNLDLIYNTLYTNLQIFRFPH